MRRLFLLSVLVAGCGVSQDLYNARVDELGKAKSELDAERKALAEEKKAAAEARRKCEGSMTDLEKEAAKLKSGKDSLSTDLEAARKRNEELRKAQEAAELRMAQYKTLMAKFKSMVDSGKLKVEIRNGLMLVKLADNILFDPGKTELKSAGKEAIKEVSGILAGIQGRKFQVAGHTDNLAIGHRAAKYKNNWELSTARAVEVVRFMIADGNMPADRVSAAGWADQLPIASNDTDEGRRQNRRIEIVLLPNIEDLPPMDDAAKP